MSTIEAVRCIKSMLDLEDPRLASDSCLGIFRALKDVEPSLDTPRVGYSTDGLGAEDIRDGNLHPTTFLNAESQRVSLTMGRKKDDVLGERNGINRPHVRVSITIMGALTQAQGSASITELLNFQIKLDSDLKPVPYIHLRKPIGDELRSLGTVTMRPGLFDVGSLGASETAHLNFERVADQDAMDVLSILLVKFQPKAFRHFLELLVKVLEWRDQEVARAPLRRMEAAEGLLNYTVSLIESGEQALEAGALGAMLGTILSDPQAERDLLVSKIPGRAVVLKNMVDT